MVDVGVDVIVAQGVEAGGHVRGDVATMALVPAVADAAGDAPVVAAGGVADGRSIAAALALGAARVWVGTRFLGAEEASIHPFYRERPRAARETDTIHSTVFDQGWPDAPHRTLTNATTAAWMAAGRPATGMRPGEGEIVAHGVDGAPIPRYASRTPHRLVDGDVEAMSMWAGQGVWRLRGAEPASAVFQALLDETEAALRSLGAGGRDGG